MGKLQVIGVEYHELASIGFKNYKLGLQITTSPEEYENDLSRLTMEVKTKLNNIIKADQTNNKTTEKTKGKTK